MTEAFRKISNSEVTDFMTCKRLYLNAYIRRLAPKTQKGPMATGTVGHMGLERYYKGRVAGEHHDTSKEAALEALKKEIPKKEYDLENILTAYSCLERYFEHYGDEMDEWEPIAIEQEYSMPLPYRTNYDMTGKLDILFRHRPSGRIVLRDWKFTYDFWRPRKFILRGQFPKYVLLLKYNGIEVDEVQIDQLRYREMKDKKDNTLYLKRSTHKISNAKMKNIIHDHMEVSDEIMKFRENSPEKQEKLATRLLVDPICKGCRFAELCELELENGDTKQFIKENFVENTYGYNKEALVDVL